MKDLKLNVSQDLKKEGKSFYWASFFLPKNSRINAGILYSICRYFDNIADKDNQDMSSFLEKSIEDIKYNKNNKVNIFLKENKINIQIFSDLIKGLITDQKKITIKDKKELIKYSYHVAGTVGLMMSKIIGVKNKKAFSCAIDLGIAMQLTNIVRDVYEDANMQRIYLPSEWLQNIDILILNGEKKIKPEQEEKISNAIYQAIELSEKFYINGFSGLKYVPLKSRLAIFIAANVYRGIGVKIRKTRKKYLKKRIYLNFNEKIFITVKSFFIFLFIPIINYKYVKIRDNLPHENL